MNIMNEDIVKQLNMIAQSLSVIATNNQKPTKMTTDFTATGFVWDAEDEYLRPLKAINAIDISLLQHIELQKDLIFKNSEQFAKSLTANNALLWGARGMGKSSLTKAVFCALNKTYKNLKLVEIHREDIVTLPKLLRQIANREERFILYCDDLSFDSGDDGYKSLKAVLEGGLEGRPDNVIFYATSNRRHLLPREMIENETANAINVRDTIDEKVSLSDRFGLWVGFHNATQQEYLDMIFNYCNHFGLKIDNGLTRRQALEWSTTRGSRTGRVAWQFISDLAGKLDQKLK